MRPSTFISSRCPFPNSPCPCCASELRVAIPFAMSATGELPPDVNRGPEILAICGSLVGVALFTVALRIWVRAAMIKHVGWDDYIMVAAMVSAPTAPDGPCSID